MKGIGAKAEITATVKRRLSINTDIGVSSLEDERDRSGKIEMENTGIGNKSNPNKFYKYQTSQVKSIGGYKEGERRKKE